MLGAKDTYEFLRDMSLLIATGGVAFITNVFATFCKLSATIDNMRSVYRNVGATSDVDALPCTAARRAARAANARSAQAPRGQCRSACLGEGCNLAIVLRAARNLPGGTSISRSRITRR
jgi:hypothetical protein